MPIPDLKAWKMWVGTEIEGSLVGKKTLFICSNKVDLNKVIPAEHLYICPEVTSLVQLENLIIKSKANHATISAKINTKKMFIAKAMNICKKQNVKFNLQYFFFAEHIPSSIRIDIKSFENLTFLKSFKTLPSQYKKDRRIE